MNSIPKGYKKTEVGVIPDDWEIKKLGDFSSFQNGIGFPIRYQGKQNGDLPFCKVSDMNLVGNEVYITRSNNYISYEEACIMNAPIVPHNSIIFAKVGAALLLNRRRIAKCKICVDNNMMALILDKCVNLYFIYQKLITIDFADYAQEGALPSINSSQISKISIAVPPLPEQKAIAEVLSDMDALIEAQKELIAKKRDIKQGDMQDLLSGRVRLPGYETKGWKHTDIGDIPDDWEVKKLGEEGVFLTTSSYTRSELKEYGDVACIHYGDIHTRFHTWLDCSSTELPMISKDMVKQYPYLKNGDLVIADASEDYEGLGDCVEICNIDSRLCIGGLHTIVYRAKPGLFAPSYIGLLRNLQVVRNQLVSQAVGTKVYSLTNSMIGSILVLVPSLLSEQQAIAEVLSDMDNEIETLEAELEKLNHMKRGMMQELLTGRIRLI